MASAILTVLYPEEFSVYDERVCDVLADFHNLGNFATYENLWKGYVSFMRRVEESAPQGLILRDKDRYLWGKSLYQQLTENIEGGFTSAADDGTGS